MLDSGADPTHIMEDGGLGLVADKKFIMETAKKVLTANTAQVSQYKSGKTSLLPFFIGKMMKETEGKIDPILTKEILLEELEKL